MGANFDPVHRVEDQGLVVEVYRAPSDRGPPVYSVRIGKEITKLEDGEQKTFIAPHIRIYQDRACITHAQLERPFALLLSGLLQQAEDWIVADMSEGHEYYLARKREHEQEMEARGKIKTRRTGKTERDREKRRHRQAAG
jgi:hypothetical protein